MTALELVERVSLAGGMDRVREVLRGLWTFCTPKGLTEALEALQQMPTAQRLGALLTLDEQDTLATQVALWLEKKPLRIVPLEPGQKRQKSSDIDSLFKVRTQAPSLTANT